jgi:hypothetical protein
MTKRGILEASCNPEVIQGWWTSYPMANIAGSMKGFRRSGLIAFDSDPRHGGSLDALPLSADELHTPTIKTGGGGTNVIYLASRVYSNSNQLLPQGIDVRTGNSYLVLPPSLHASGLRYSWAPEKSPWEIPFLPLPEALVPLLKIRDWPVKKRKYSAPDNPLPVDETSSHPYVQKALREELNKLAQAPEGRRNIILNQVAFCLGQFVQARLLARGNVESMLKDVAKTIGLGERETQATINSGLKAGMANPRQNWPEL